MRQRTRARPSPALIVAIAALVAALGGSAIAEVAGTSLSKKDKKRVKKVAKKQATRLDADQDQRNFPVDASQIAGGAVGASELATGAVGSSQLAPGAVGSDKVAPGAIGASSLSSSIPAVRATGGQSLDSGATEPLEFDQEAYDTGGMHSNTTENHLLVAPVTGVYLLTASAIWGADPDGYRRLAFFVNGDSGAPLAEQHVPAVDSGPTGITMTTVTRLAAGDDVRVNARQTSGESSTPTASSSMTFLAPGP